MAPIHFDLGSMEIVVIYPDAFWFLLILPTLQIFHSKYVKKPSILTPNVALLKKIAGTSPLAKFDFLIFCRHMEILLLIIAYAEPMVMTSDSVARCNRYFAAVSLGCFLVEIFLRNTFFHKIP
jgi:hypothetical protein